MNLIDQIVKHRAFGQGKIIAQDGNYLIVSFPAGEKKFTYPEAFSGFLTAVDTTIRERVQEELDEFASEKARIQQELEFQRHQKYTTTDSIRKRVKLYPRANIAFKCNYCDGGQSDKQIGFNGVCSDDLICNNIKIEHRTWCNSNDCPCLHYYNGEITREKLDAKCERDGFVCYESQMLRNWKALAGIVQNGDNKGKPMKLNQVQANSLCVLTTRDSQSIEKSRYIFAAFLVDETYEGDGREEGYVSTNSEYKIKLSPSEARSMLFWNYHANDSQPEVAVWSSGLHRYFEDNQAAQILRDIAQIKKCTQDENLAQRFYHHFCKVNGVDTSSLGTLSGALKR